MDENRINDSLIYLIHIQKTAGTSVRFYLEKAFGPEKCLWHAPNLSSETRGNLSQIAVSDPGRFNRYKAIGGHISFGRIPSPILDRRPIFVSALRNPVARIVSHYQHIRNSAGHGLHDQVGNKTLFKALKTRGFAAVSDRVQIDYLCGRKDLKYLLEALNRSKYIIGKQEKIESLFRYLSTTFGFPVFQDVHVNIGAPGYEKQIEEQPDYHEAVELIRRMNKEEYDFYKSFEAVWSNV
jgi:hypothetical protein